MKLRYFKSKDELFEELYRSALTEFSERTREFALTTAFWFRRFKPRPGASIPDERAAALIYAGSYYGLVTVVNFLQ